MFARFAEESPLVGYEPNALVEVSRTEVTTTLLLSRKASIGSTYNSGDDIAATPAASEMDDSLLPKPSTIMLRHFDQDERESDGSRHWAAMKSVLLKKFVRGGVQDFSDEVWLQKIFEGSSKKIFEYCKNKDGAIQRHSGGIPIETELMGYVKIPPNWKRYIFHKGLSWNFQSILGKELIPGGEER